MATGTTFRQRCIATFANAGCGRQHVFIKLMPWRNDQRHPDVGGDRKQGHSFHQPTGHNSEFQEDDLRQRDTCRGVILLFMQ